MAGDKPDFEVHIPVGKRWYKVGVGWKNPKGHISLHLDLLPNSNPEGGYTFILHPVRERGDMGGHKPPPGFGTTPAAPDDDVPF